MTSSKKINSKIIDLVFEVNYKKYFFKEKCKIFDILEE